MSTRFSLNATCLRLLKPSRREFFFFHLTRHFCHGFMTEVKVFFFFFRSRRNHHNCRLPIKNILSVFFFTLVHTSIRLGFSALRNIDVVTDDHRSVRAECDYCVVFNNIYINRITVVTLQLSLSLCMRVYYIVRLGRGFLPFFHGDRV